MGKCFRLDNRYFLFIHGQFNSNVCEVCFVFFPFEKITFLKSSDKDECTTIQDICGFGTCKNLPGSYSCVCNQGYRYDASTKRCVGKFSFPRKNKRTKRLKHNLALDFLF